MYLFLHLLDRGQIPEALQSLGQAETVFEQSASDLPGEMLGYFVYANAFLKPDAACARYWWNLIQAKKARRDCTEYWLAHQHPLDREPGRGSARSVGARQRDCSETSPGRGVRIRSLFRRLRQTLDGADSTVS